MIRVLSGNELGLPTPKSFASKVASGNPLVRSGKPPPSNYPFGPGALRCEHRRLSRRLAHGQSEPKRRCWSVFRLVSFVYPPAGRRRGVSGIEQYRRRTRSGKSTLPGGTCRKSTSWFFVPYVCFLPVSCLALQGGAGWLEVEWFEMPVACRWVCGWPSNRWIV